MALSRRNSLFSFSPPLCVWILELPPCRLEGKAERKKAKGKVEKGRRRKKKNRRGRNLYLDPLPLSLSSLLLIPSNDIFTPEFSHSLRIRRESLQEEPTPKSEI